MYLTGIIELSSRVWRKLNVSNSLLLLRPLKQIRKKGILVILRNISYLFTYIAILFWYHLLDHHKL